MPFRKFENTRKVEWDSFVFEKSVNGNFLQSRAFLSYHPEGRFDDASLMYYDAKGVLRAVIPAAATEGDFGIELVSHPGSTYGGIVLDRKTCSAKRVQALVDELLHYLKEEGFISADLRFPPDFMWNRKDANLLEYMLGLNGFSERIELTTYIDFSTYKESILANFSQGKRTNVNNCFKKGLICRELESDEEIEAFYRLLCANLNKYDAKPVHTVEELKLLHKKLLAGSTVMLGVFSGEFMIAAGWLFLFKNQSVVHTQYLCADGAYSTLSPMTFLYYSAIQFAREKGFDYLSWGISTEEKGRVLNWGLTESKESFGSLHGVHRAFHIDFV